MNVKRRCDGGFRLCKKDPICKNACHASQLENINRTIAWASVSLQKNELPLKDNVILTLRNELDASDEEVAQVTVQRNLLADKVDLLKNQVRDLRERFAVIESGGFKDADALAAKVLELRVELETEKKKHQEKVQDYAKLTTDTIEAHCNTLRALRDAKTANIEKTEESELGYELDNVDRSTLRHLRHLKGINPSFSNLCDDETREALELLLNVTSTVHVGEPDDS
jgi:hypothetical protein